MPPRPPSTRSSQKGSMVVETVIAILLFSIGILTLIGLQATAIKVSAESKNRSEAAFLGNQVIAQMWVDAGNMASYAHNPTGSLCTPSGGATTHSPAVAWLNTVNAALPGATSDRQQVIVDSTTRTVTVSVCWQYPGEARPHSYVARAQIRG